MRTAVIVACVICTGAIGAAAAVFISGNTKTTTRVELVTRTVTRTVEAPADDSTESTRDMCDGLVTNDGLLPHVCEGYFPREYQSQLSQPRFRYCNETQSRLRDVCAPGALVVPDDLPGE